MALAEIQGFCVSPQQRRLLLLREKGFQPLATALVEIEGDLQPGRLRQSLHSLADRHSILRTVFRRAPGMKVPLQVISDSPLVSWRCLDWRGRPPSDQQAGLGKLFRQEGQKPPCLQRGPVVRAWLIALSRRRHALLIALPSLCADARSIERLVEGMASFQLKEAPQRQEDDLQYIHFSEWQNQLLEEDDFGGKDYWNGRGIANLPAIRLPFERRNAGEPAPQTDSCCWDLDAGLTERVSRLSRRQGLFESTVCLSGWQALLYRMTGQPQIGLGLCVEGRGYQEFQGAVGLFARCLPICGRLGDALPFDKLLHDTQAATLEAAEWQDYFGGRADGESPLEAVGWEAGFEFQQAPQAIQAEGLSFALLKRRVAIDRFKLLLCCSCGPHGIRASLRFDPHRFRRRDIQRLAKRYQTLLANAVDTPQAPLGELEALCESERRQLLVDLNRTRKGYRDGICVHQLIESAASRRPHAAAAVFESQHLSYGQLNMRANRLAHALRRLGVGPEVVTAVHLERSPDLVAALLGILKAGGAYLPLDLASPPARQGEILQDAGAPAVLSRQQAWGDLPQSQSRILLCLNQLAEDATGQDQHGPHCGAAPENLCYVLYTSGSTGKPKGVMIPHSGLVNYLSWCCDAYPMASGWRGAPVHSPIGFDLTVTSLLYPLTQGRAVELLPEERGLEALSEELVSDRPFSLVKLTPAHLEVLAQIVSERDSLAAPETLVVGGEALKWESLSYWRRRAPGLRVINEYGPTEAVVGCCVYEVPLETGHQGGVPIGRPIANAQIYLLNSCLRPVPAGAAGEILIGGAGLARGYLGQACISAEKFIPHPFSAEPGSRLYRTGDLARFGPDGEIEFLGRNDHQVKIRGYRVEPGEVETVLSQHSQVRECLVTAREDLPGGRGLVAYLVSGKGAAPPAAQELRAFLGHRLPDYLIPLDFVPLKQLPLTPNGKIDRQALPAPALAGSRATAAYVRPRDALELRLVKIWESLLERSPISVTDNFFEIGGHSLLAVRLMVQIRKKLGRELPLSILLFEAASVAGLASLLRRRCEAIPWNPVVEIQQGSSLKRPLFLVHAHGGTVISYFDLARRLGKDVPVFGLQAQGRDDGRQPLSSIEDMAAAYLKGIRQIQPQGPYRLGGWSMGGLVAFEMARQLDQAGESVDVLALLDSDFSKKEILDDAQFLVETMGEELELPIEELRRFEDRDQMLAYAAQRARQMNVIHPDFELEDLRQLFKLYKAHYDAIQGYHPECYFGPISYVLSVWQFEKREYDMLANLEALAQSGLEIHALPVHHMDFVREPHVQTIAALLRYLLERHAPAPPGDCEKANP